MGLDDYLVKPLEFERLKNTLIVYTHFFSIKNQRFMNCLRRLVNFFYLLLKDNIRVAYAPWRGVIPLSIFLLSGSFSATAQCDIRRDSLALVALYDSTNGNQWLNTIRNDHKWKVIGMPISNWFGVTVNTEGCVVCLDLDGEPNCSGKPSGYKNLGNGLKGTLPTKIGNLLELQGLYLNNNTFPCKIPKEIGNLKNLKELDLSYNAPSVTPVGGFSHLNGSIPIEIGKLEKLEKLNLGGNQFNDTIPKEIGNLKNLTELLLWGCQLKGAIPPEIGNLTKLQNFQATQNKLFGEIPKELGKLSNLIYLYLSYNFLSGKIPNEIGLLNNLQHLDLSSNNLSYNIPSSFSQLYNLKTLSLDNNIITGTIDVLCSLDSLESLHLTNNKLNGAIPAKISNLSKLYSLRASNNDLTGNIPKELGNLTGLVHLILQSNHLTGSIPKELGNLKKLFRLNLKNNNLSGCFPIGLQSLCGLGFNPDTNKYVKGYNFTDNPSLQFGGDFQYFCNNNPIPVIIRKDSICLNQPYHLPSGRIIKQSGVYIDTLMALTGCDSIFVFTLVNKNCEKATNKTPQDIISTAITPNEDGYNDKLDFPDIDWTKYPNNEIEIFNRWGQRIFYAQPYQRNWKGQNDNGQELPAGDYFFILRLNIAEKILVGSVYLQR